MANKIKKKSALKPSIKTKTKASKSTEGKVIQYKRVGEKLVGSVVKNRKPNKKDNSTINIGNGSSETDKFRILYDELVNKTLKDCPGVKLISFEEWYSKKIQNGEDGVCKVPLPNESLREIMPAVSDLNALDEKGIIQLGAVQIEMPPSSMDMYRQYQLNMLDSHPGQSQMTFTEFCMKHLPKMFLNVVEQKFQAMLNGNNNHEVPNSLAPLNYDVLNVVKAWGFASSYQIGNAIRLIAQADASNMLANLKDAVTHLNDQIKEIDIEINRP